MADSDSKFARTEVWISKTAERHLSAAVVTMTDVPQAGPMVALRDHDGDPAAIVVLSIDDLRAVLAAAEPHAARSPSHQRRTPWKTRS